MFWATWSNSEVGQGDSETFFRSKSLYYFIFIIFKCCWLFWCSDTNFKLFQKCGSGLATHPHPLGKSWLANSFVPQFFSWHSTLKARCYCAPWILGRDVLNTNHFHRGEILGRTPASPPHTNFRKAKREFIILFFGLLTFCLSEGLLLILSPLRREKTNWQMPARWTTPELSFAFSQWKIGICCQT